jgi:hypothetical protein
MEMYSYRRKKINEITIEGDLKMDDSIYAFPHADLKDVMGMSLRDYFAAKAMQGCLRADLRLENNTISGLAEMSYTIADAMLKAREK